MAADLRAAIIAELEASTRIAFPSPRYQQDPIAFHREILGVEPWAEQIKILEAVRDHSRVAVRSGHKIGKSHCIAGLALWFYCSYRDARVVCTSTTARQVDQIIWRELRMMRARSGRCTACKHDDPDGHRIPRPCPHSALIDGELAELARSGLKSDDFREVVGFTAREAEAVAGISGRNLLYLADEASGIPNEIFEAIEGNRAGGARIALFSNPTRNEGEFYEAFTEKAALYRTITVSSEQTPNVVEGRLVIPGLATREWIEEKKEEWGENSPLYLVRVKGVHATREDGKIFSVHLIGEAEQRWDDTPESGRLFVGLDPAGESGMGDESAFAVRRGRKLLALQTARGLSDEAHLVRVLSLCDKYRLPRETPVVVVDSEGSVGSKVWIAIRNFADANKGKIEAIHVRASDKSPRQPHIFDRMRDALTANLEAWFRDGGAILEDAKLEKELHAFEWKQQPNGKLKVTPKETVKKLIGRSPDRYDALALSVWEPLSLEEGPLPESVTRTPATPEQESYAPVLDPWSGLDAWGRK